MTTQVNIDTIVTRPPVTSRVPALAAAVAEFVAAGQTTRAIAKRLRLTDSYVAKLRRINRYVAPDILDEWQRSSKPLGVDAMLGVCASEEQHECYRQLATSTRDQRRLEAKKRRARDYGRALGRLDVAGFVNLTPPFDEFVGIMIPTLDFGDRREVGAAAESGWEEGLREHDGDDDDFAEDEGG